MTQSNRVPVEKPWTLPSQEALQALGLVQQRLVS
jgi:hypothetical protein